MIFFVVSGFNLNVPMFFVWSNFSMLIYSNFIFYVQQKIFNTI